MAKAKTHVVSTRLSLNEVAKVRDGIIAKGISPDKLTSISQILRTAAYLTIINCDDPKGPPSEDSLNFLKQSWKKTKLTSNIQLGELEEL